METIEKLVGKIEKGWGYELIWATNDKYCGKMLIFEKAGNKFSMHFHKEKDESWYVDDGKFLLKWIDTETAVMHKQELIKGNVWRNKPLVPHQLEALEDKSSIIEVSTPDSEGDNYRVAPGDSQIKDKEENEND